MGSSIASWLGAILQTSLKPSGFKCPWAWHSLTLLIWPWTLQSVAVLGHKSYDWGCWIHVIGMRTCSRPPFRSSSSLGGPGSGPGLPLCRHHRASREVLQENGPSRRRLRSFSPVLTSRSCSSSCTDAAWTASRKTEAVAMNGMQGTGWNDRGTTDGKRYVKQIWTTVRKNVGAVTNL